jgi:hypothetical protein
LGLSTHFADEAAHELQDMTVPLQRRLALRAARVHFGVRRVLLGQISHLFDLFVETQLPQLLLDVIRPSHL